MQKILVTGALGFIGSHFVNMLLEKGYDPQDILIIDSFTYAADINNIHETLRNRIVNIDIAADELLIIEDIDKFKPEFIFHFAAESHVDRSIISSKPFLETNIVGTVNMVNLARRHQAKFIHMSTDEIYGAHSINSDYEHVEKDKYDPKNPYSASKAAAELMIKSIHSTFKDFNYNIIRATNNFGPNQADEKFMPTVIRAICTEQPIPVYGTGRYIREWFYVRDCTEAIFNIARFGANTEIYNIGPGNRNRYLNTYMIQLIIMAFRELGFDELADKATIKNVTDRPGHDARYALNCQKYEQLLYNNNITNLPVKSFKDALMSTVLHYKEKYLGKN